MISNHYKTTIYFFVNMVYPQNTIIFNLRYIICIKLAKKLNYHNTDNILTIKFIIGRLSLIFKLTKLNLLCYARLVKR